MLKDQTVTTLDDAGGVVDKEDRDISPTVQSALRIPLCRLQQGRNFSNVIFVQLIALATSCEGAVLGNGILAAIG